MNIPVWLCALSHYGQVFDISSALLFLPNSSSVNGTMGHKHSIAMWWWALGNYGARGRPHRLASSICHLERIMPTDATLSLCWRHCHFIITAATIIRTIPHLHHHWWTEKRRDWSSIFMLWLRHSIPPVKLDCCISAHLHLAWAHAPPNQPFSFPLSTFSRRTFLWRSVCSKLAPVYNTKTWERLPFVACYIDVEVSVCRYCIDVLREYHTTAHIAHYVGCARAARYPLPHWTILLAEQGDIHQPPVPLPEPGIIVPELRHIDVSLHKHKLVPPSEPSPHLWFMNLASRCRLPHIPSVDRSRCTGRWCSRRERETERQRLQRLQKRMQISFQASVDLECSQQQHTLTHSSHIEHIESDGGKVCLSNTTTTVAATTIASDKSICCFLLVLRTTLASANIIQHDGGLVITHRSSIYFVLINLQVASSPTL